MLLLRFSFVSRTQEAGCILKVVSLKYRGKGSTKFKNLEPYQKCRETRISLEFPLTFDCSTLIIINEVFVKGRSVKSAQNEARHNLFLHSGPSRLIEGQIDGGLHNFVFMPFHLTWFSIGLIVKKF